MRTAAGVRNQIVAECTPWLEQGSACSSFFSCSSAAQSGSPKQSKGSLRKEKSMVLCLDSGLMRLMLSSEPFCAGYRKGFAKSARI